jgi:hypothetical protein
VSNTFTIDDIPVLKTAKQYTKCFEFKATQPYCRVSTILKTSSGNATAVMLVFEGSIDSFEVLLQNEVINIDTLSNSYDPLLPEPVQLAYTARSNLVDLFELSSVRIARVQTQVTMGKTYTVMLASTYNRLYTSKPVFSVCFDMNLVLTIA